ncbi:MAG: hypothetical protein Q7S28_02490 [bacterium]|nr:hypothetical protein [bacterium]
MKKLVLGLLVAFVIAVIMGVTGIRSNFGKAIVKRDQFCIATITKNPWPNIFRPTIVYEAWPRAGSESITIMPVFFLNSRAYTYIHVNEAHVADFVYTENQGFDYRSERQGHTPTPSVVRENAQVKFCAIKRMLEEEAGCLDCP